MRHPISLINISEWGELIYLITYEPNLREIIQTNAVIKCIGLRKHMKPTSPKMIFLTPMKVLDTVRKRKLITKTLRKHTSYIPFTQTHPNTNEPVPVAINHNSLYVTPLALC